MLTLTIVAACLLASAWAIWRLSERRREEHCAEIDALIAVNAAQKRPGMERPDYGVIERNGERRWQDVQRAQTRTGQRGDTR